MSAGVGMSLLSCAGAVVTAAAGTGTGVEAGACV